MAHGKVGFGKDKMFSYKQKHNSAVHTVEQENFDPSEGNKPDIMGTQGAGLINSQIAKIGKRTTKLSKGTKITPVVKRDRPNKLGKINTPELKKGVKVKATGGTNKPFKRRSLKRKRKSSARFN